VAERLDEERLETLRAWGAGLETDVREELRAAGRAITILAEEIERLHVDLWHARGAVTSQALALTLRDRLRGVISRNGD
jgi:hypothetical protein